MIYMLQNNLLPMLIGKRILELCCQEMTMIFGVILIYLIYVMPEQKPAVPADAVPNVVLGYVDSIAVVYAVISIIAIVYPI